MISFYSRVSVDDPFVNNMKSISKAAATKTMTQGELYSPNAFELTSKSRWYRGENQCSMCVLFCLFIFP